jgi:hypothetical protein
MSSAPMTMARALGTRIFAFVSPGPAVKGWGEPGIGDANILSFDWLMEHPEVLKSPGYGATDYASTLLQ